MNTGSKGNDVAVESIDHFTWNTLPKDIILLIFQNIVYIPKEWNTISKHYRDVLKSLLDRQDEYIKKIKVFSNVMRLANGYDYTKNKYGDYSNTYDLFSYFGKKMFDDGVMNKDYYVTDSLNKKATTSETIKVRLAKTQLRVFDSKQKIIYNCGKVVHSTAENLNSLINWVNVVYAGEIVALSLVAFNDVLHGDEHIRDNLLDYNKESKMHLVKKKWKRDILSLAISSMLTYYYWSNTTSTWKARYQHYCENVIDNICEIMKIIDHPCDAQWISNDQNPYNVMKDINSPLARQNSYHNPLDNFDIKIYKLLAMIFSNNTMIDIIFETKIWKVRMGEEDEEEVIFTIFVNDDVFHTYETQTLHISHRHNRTAKKNEDKFGIRLECLQWIHPMMKRQLEITKKSTEYYYIHDKILGIWCLMNSIKPNMYMADNATYYSKIYVHVKNYYERVVKRLCGMNIDICIDKVLEVIDLSRMNYYETSHMIFLMKYYSDYSGHMATYPVEISPKKHLDVELSTVNGIKYLTKSHYTFLKHILDGTNLCKLFEYIRNKTISQSDCLWRYTILLTRYILFHPEIHGGSFGSMRENFEVFKNLICTVESGIGDLKFVIGNDKDMRRDLWIECIGLFKTVLTSETGINILDGILTNDDIHDIVKHIVSISNRRSITDYLYKKHDGQMYTRKYYDLIQMNVLSIIMHLEKMDYELFCNLINCKYDTSNIIISLLLSKNTKIIMEDSKVKPVSEVLLKFANDNIDKNRLASGKRKKITDNNDDGNSSKRAKITPNQ